MYYNHWSTYLYCDGEPMHEYRFRIENENTVSCYIASEAGKEFSVKWKNDLFVMASADCYMDGRCMGCSRTGPGRRGSRWGIRTDADVRQPFQFAPLILTDDDEIADPDDGSVANLGIIEVRVYRVTQSFQPRMSEYKTRPAPERVPVHERSKKAGTHVVSLGEGIRCAPHVSSASPRVRYIDRPEHPYLRFIFRYRPKALLQAEGIIPPDPPSTEGGKRNLVQGNNREPSSKRARFEYVKQELRTNTNGPDSDGELAEIETILRTGSSDNGHPLAAPAIKAEPSAAYATVIDVDAEVIDLTLDD